MLETTIFLLQLAITVRDITKLRKLLVKILHKTSPRDTSSCHII